MTGTTPSSAAAQQQAATAGMVNIALDSPSRGSSSSGPAKGNSREVLLAGGGSSGPARQQGQQQAATTPSGSSSAASSSRPATPSPGRAGAANNNNKGRGRSGSGSGSGSASSASIALLAAIMGNVLEFYDFSVYAFFAPEIGKLFFPAGSPTARAVRTFTVFAGGFLMRPIGSVLLGAIGDKYGTAAALKWSIALMTVPTVVTGCLPTYHHVGMAAPFLLTACRLLQGLSVGGELIGALLHTSDHSPDHRRGFLCGVVAVFGSMGNLLGSIVSVGMRRALSDEQLLSWGWRVPFLTGSILGVVGILLRTQTKGLHQGEGEEAADERLPLHNPDLAQAHEEEPSSLLVIGECLSPAVLEADRTRDYRERHGHRGHGQQQQQAAEGPGQPHEPVTFLSVMRAAAGADKLRFFQVVVLAALNNAHFYLHFVWLGTYLAQLGKHPIPASQAFAVTCVAQACFILTNPLWGAMGDRFGGPEKRLRWNLAGVVLGCVLPPLLFKLTQSGQLQLDFLYAAISGLLMGFVISGNYYAWVCEALHDSPARVMTTSVAYNLGAITGGAYPMLASALADFKEPTAPVLPVALAAVLGFGLLVYMQRRLDQNGAAAAAASSAVASSGAAGGKKEGGAVEMGAVRRRGKGEEEEEDGSPVRLHAGSRDELMMRVAEA